MTAKGGAAPLLVEDPETHGVKELRTVEPSNLPAPTVPEAVSMIERLAKDPAVDVDKLQRLIDMQKDVLKHQAEAAFNAAFAEMQADLPTIAERASTDKTTYAPIEDIVEAVRPVLKAHGFSLSFETQWPEKNTVRVVGILTHREGHSRRSEFLAGADQTGSKNAIQALGSSVSYGRRYTTTDLLCIVTRKASAMRDDDGEGSEKPAPPDGCDAWWATLEGIAANGTAAFDEAWDRSKPEYKTHVMKHERSAFNAMKAKAAAVTRQRRGGRP